jgi:O-antigen/teichoic acid export membrane protein
MAFYGLNGASLDATAKTKVSGVLAALLTVFSVAFNFLLVPAFGAVGAACANFLCYAVIVGAGFYYLKTRRGIELRDSARQYAVFIAFAVFYLAFLEKGGFAFKTVAFAVFLIASFVANKALAAEMIDRGRSLVKNKA